MQFIRRAFLTIVVLLVVLVISNTHTVFPIMEYDEYFEQHRFENIVLHNKGCEYCKVPYFTIKHKKYDILIKKNTKFCKVCFGSEEVMLLLKIHQYNYRRYESCCKTHGEKEAKRLTSKYVKNPNVDNFFY